MIGNGLVRFHGDTTQSGGGLWKEIKKSGLLYFVTLCQKRPWKE